MQLFVNKILRRIYLGKQKHNIKCKYEYERNRY